MSLSGNQGMACGYSWKSINAMKSLQTKVELLRHRNYSLRKAVDIRRRKRKRKYLPKEIYFLILMQHTCRYSARENSPRHKLNWRPRAGTEAIKGNSKETSERQKKAEMKSQQAEERIWGGSIIDQRSRRQNSTRILKIGCKIGFNE